MQHHGNTHVSASQRKQIVLALSLALGLAASQGQATPTTSSPLPSTEYSPAAALMRSAAAAGIAVPRDLPYIMELAAKRQAETDAARPKATIPVSNCDNSGPGSLRAAVGFADSGDIIDLSGLNCSITLSSSIVTSVEDLTLKGDPDSKYRISGNNAIRPLIHSGTGTLTLDGIIVSSGRATSSGTNTVLQGGCVRSQGSVVLTNQAQVKYCEARNTANSGSPTVEGGAIFAATSVLLDNGARVAHGTAISERGIVRGGGIRTPFVQLSGGLVEHNTARITGDGTNASGGGIHTDQILGKYSVVRRNEVLVSGSASSTLATGAGMEVTGEEGSSIKYSTFNNNTVNATGALFAGGAAVSFGTSSSATSSLTIKSSTIANNTTINSRKYGGALSLRKDAVIRSSTISGNVEKNDTTNIAESKYGAGISLSDGVQLTMTSTIVADNHAMALTGEATLPSDLGLNNPESDAAEVIGTQNFRHYAHADIIWPDGNFGNVGADIRLGPLKDNGGLTSTMMPEADSPVIDNGGTTGLGNPLNPDAPLVDQRGPGFPRVVGPQADIGAVEWSARIFADGFESD